MLISIVIGAQTTTKPLNTAVRDNIAFHDAKLEHYRKTDGSNPVLNSLTGRDVHNILSSVNNQTLQSKLSFFVKTILRDPVGTLKGIAKTFSDTNVGGMSCWDALVFACAAS
jgi:hypothetical protein